MFTAPDGHLPYIVQLHIMSIQPANKAAEHLISSLWLVSEKKTEAVNAYLIKNTVREREREKEEEKKRGVGGGGHFHKQRERETYSLHKEPIGCISPPPSQILFLSHNARQTAEVLWKIWSWWGPLLGWLPMFLFVILITSTCWRKARCLRTSFEKASSCKQNSSWYNNK